MCLFLKSKKKQKTQRAAVRIPPNAEFLIKNEAGILQNLLAEALVAN